MIRLWVLRWLEPRYDGPSARDIGIEARFNALEDEVARQYAAICKLQEEHKSLNLHIAAMQKGIR